MFIGNCADFVWDFHCFRCDDISYHWENKPQLSNCTAAAQQREFSHCSEMSILLNEPNWLMLIKNQKLHPSEVPSFLRKLFILKIIFNFSIRRNSSELAAAASLVFRGNLCVFRSRYDSSLLINLARTANRTEKSQRFQHRIWQNIFSPSRNSPTVHCVYTKWKMFASFSLFSPQSTLLALCLCGWEVVLSVKMYDEEEKMEDNIFPPLSNS